MMKITILCSAFGLGFYIPGVLLKRKFEKRGIEAKLYVFENYLDDIKKNNIKRNQEAYHNNFSLAKLSARIPMNIAQSVDSEKLELLLDEWNNNDLENFISLSGHWSFILEKYKERKNKEALRIDLLYIDCGLAPSWKSIKKYYPSYEKNTYVKMFYDYKRKCVNYMLGIEENKSYLEFAKRNKRYLVHGGGWGMGNYRDIIHELSKKKLKLDIIIYDVLESFGEGDVHNRFFMNTPEWTAYQGECKRENELPLGVEVRDGEIINTVIAKGWHWVYEIARKRIAIISKPGAGTLIDSLEAATPLIMLEPFGEHEKMNFQMWDKLGFGISYEEWKKSGFSESVLYEMHNNIINAKIRCTDYVDEYIRMHMIKIK